MDRARRSALAVSTAGLLCVFAALSGAASAATAAGGVKGDPQPELKPFNISTATSAGTAAMQSNGSIVVTYDVHNSSRTFVCVLARGGHKCSHSVTIKPPGSLTDFDTPQVFAPSPNHVVVLQATCCDTNPNGDDLLYTSTNAGRSFGAPVRVGGTVSVDTAALIGSNIVFAQNGSGGAQVESIPVTASGPPASTANPITAESFSVGAGSYHGGALIATDLTNNSTDVAYAPSGRDFNATGSYHSVGHFRNENLLAISGDALLTLQSSGKGDAVLRLFNGKGFGPAHVVPGHGTGGPQAFGIDQDPSGRVHVFADRAGGYRLIEVSTSNGTRWSSRVDLGNAIANTFFSAALDSHGSGLVLGTAGPGRGYPVLASQSVSFSLKSSKIRKGHSTTGSGKVSPAGSGRKVELQKQGHGGLWFTVATTHENASGSFKFTIKGKSAGKFHYRAVASDLAGYLMYGYSSSRLLQVTG
jgi:hypothetical protein